MTAKEIKDYIVYELECEPQHDLEAASIAAKRTSNLFEETEPEQIVRFIFGNEPISHYTHSYGFHTREGRAIREFFRDRYEENTN